MQINAVPFCTIDWEKIVPTEHAGTTGVAYWRTFEMGNIRVRMVEYTPGYLADHWCKKRPCFISAGRRISHRA